MLKDILENFNKPKNYLILGNIFLVLFLIILNNLGVIPLRAGDLAFFAVLILALALYRPGWAFLIFIGMIMLENINLAPEILGLNIRPYQFIGFLIILAIIIRLFTKRLNFQLAKLKFPDYLVLIITVAGFLSVAGATDRIGSLKLAVIFASFAALYYLVRCYIQNTEDIKKIIPFFLGSSIVVVLYGIWQNIRFIYGGANFETMPGRSNATFMEADWLGIFIVLVICVIYALRYVIFNLQFSIFNKSSIFNDQINTKYKIQNTKYILYIFLVLTFIALILTVSRSAWLGAFAASFIFLFIILTDLRFKNWNWKMLLKNFIFIAGAGIISLTAVYVFHLTNFQLFNRVQSTGSGLQKITISCGFPSEIHKILKQSSTITIKNIDELKQYNCRHINLEDIEKEKTAGNIIYEIYRKDPNISIRSEIYQKSWQQIKKHPMLGIGWGNIGQILGKDANGNYLNSSNIFLEIWLGSGIIGIISFVILLLYVLIKAVKNYFFAQDDLQKTISLFFIISWLGIIIANLFNAGIFLGFFWIWLAIANIKYEHRH